VLGAVLGAGQLACTAGMLLDTVLCPSCGVTLLQGYSFAGIVVSVTFPLPPVSALASLASVARQTDAILSSPVVSDPSVPPSPANHVCLLSLLSPLSPLASLASVGRQTDAILFAMAFDPPPEGPPPALLSPPEDIGEESTAGYETLPQVSVCPPRLCYPHLRTQEKSPLRVMRLFPR